MVWLYRYEAKGIQAWVLGTGRLREIAGGSALIESLGHEVEARASRCGGTVQTAAAGSATIVFESKDKLESFAKDWLLKCAQTLPGLTMIHGWIEVDAVVHAEHWGRLHERLEACRQRATKPLPAAGPLVNRAPRSGLPATGAVRTRGAPVIADAIAIAQSGAYKDGIDALLDRALPKDRGDRPQKTSRPVENFEDFGDEYIAVVHADGNGIGKLFMDSRWTSNDRRELSTALSKSTEAAAQIAARSLIERLGPDWELGRIPLRPIVLGGDDYTVVLRARDAVPFTECFLDAFEQETRRLVPDRFHEGKGFTACAGVALVKPEFPFVQAYALAEELCAHAKRTTPTHEQRKASGLVFHRVTTASVRRYDEILREELSSGRALESASDASPGDLTWGVWTTGTDGTLSSLYDLATGLQDESKGAIREWLTLAALDVGQAEKHWRRVLDVRSLRGRRGTQAWIDEPLRRLEVDPDTLWRGTGSSRRSPISDALVLFSVSKGFPERWLQPTGGR
ncbi:MAG: hypothetical protein Q8Q09_22205 [Deltaproteobacteria bacterium]|nr:hypothetical protein [Deltaproteobacteria bacterium]